MVSPVVGAALFVGAAVTSAALIVVLRPWLKRYALARPNARSSHTAPTPQGAGIAVIAAALGATSAFAWAALGAGGDPNLLPLVLAIIGLAVIGLVDDIMPLSARLRLLVQFAAAAGLVLALPAGARALPFLPHVMELAILLVGLVWFVNLTNFMDGIDGITVAAITPTLAGIALLAANATAHSDLDIVMALALAGALVGFYPFNRHVARAFLGDVGSLAIGGITGYLLLRLACSGHLIPALILPLYYLADTGVTLFLRWRRGAQLSQAHREHFYQRAQAAGLMVPEIVQRVFGLNCGLALIAVAVGHMTTLWMQLLWCAAAGLLTAATLRSFASGTRFSALD